MFSVRHVRALNAKKGLLNICDIWFENELNVDGIMYPAP